MSTKFIFDNTFYSMHNAYSAHMRGLFDELYIINCASPS